jgi:hypothetical protein
MGNQKEQSDKEKKIKFTHNSGKEERTEQKTYKLPRKL